MDSFHASSGHSKRLARLPLVWEKDGHDKTGFLVCRHIDLGSDWF